MIVNPEVVQKTPYIKLGITVEERRKRNRKVIE